jgi:AraC-like DNA-binding protein
VEHSEALAVWAFRTRVWNYLVKPVATAELIDNLLSLTRVLAQARRPGSPMLAPAIPSLPGKGATQWRSSPHDVLAPAIQYIEQHYDQALSANDLARMCGRNRFQFSRLFHRTFGVTFQQYLLRHRISEACRLLRKPGASVTQVGYSVGFNDGSYFARIFKRYTGVLPSRFAAGHTATVDFTAPGSGLTRAPPDPRLTDLPAKVVPSQD